MRAPLRAFGLLISFFLFTACGRCESGLSCDRDLGSLSEAERTALCEWITRELSEGWEESFEASCEGHALRPAARSLDACIHGEWPGGRTVREEEAWVAGVAADPCRDLP